MAFSEARALSARNAIFHACRFLRWLCPNASASRPCVLPFRHLKLLSDAGLPYFSAEAVLLIYAKNVSPELIMNSSDNLSELVFRRFKNGVGLRRESAPSEVKREIEHVLNDFWFAVDLEKMVAMKKMYLGPKENAELARISSSPAKQKFLSYVEKIIKTDIGTGLRLLGLFFARFTTRESLTKYYEEILIFHRVRAISAPELGRASPKAFDDALEQILSSLNRMDTVRSDKQMLFAIFLLTLRRIFDAQMPRNWALKTGLDGGPGLKTARKVSLDERREILRAIHRKGSDEFRSFVAKALDFVASRGPFDCIIDALNVGLYALKPKTKRDAESVAAHISACTSGLERMGARPLIVLHNGLPQIYENPVLFGLKRESALLTPRFAEDEDSLFLFLALHCGLPVVSNDKMRKTAQRLGALPTRRWTASSTFGFWFARGLELRLWAPHEFAAAVERRRAVFSGAPAAGFGAGDWLWAGEGARREEGWPSYAYEDHRGARVGFEKLLTL